MLNSVCLAIDDPTLEIRPPYLVYMDYIFIVVFTIEMITKIIAQGFIMQPHSYLRDPWNVVSVHCFKHLDGLHCGKSKSCKCWI